MTEQNDQAKEFEDWWPEGREWWIANGESVRNFVRQAFLAGWQRRDDQLARVARTPGPVSMPWPKKKAEPNFLPAQVTNWPAPHWTPDFRDMPPGPDRTAAKHEAFRQVFTPGRFAGTQDPSMSLQAGSEVPPPPPGTVIEAGEHTFEMVVSDDTNPGIEKFEHTGSVWAGTKEAPEAMESFDAAFDRLDDAWGAPGPVRSALSYQEEE